mmetsp:Transcript_7899/g.17063  ORF Transcript_7899/g.17063 Transcript_7899/m.17063 type:complete len:268 (+) Transcript_7899:278-1081(+)
MGLPRRPPRRQSRENPSRFRPRLSPGPRSPADTVAAKPPPAAAYSPAPDPPPAFPRELPRGECPRIEIHAVGSRRQRRRGPMVAAARRGLLPRDEVSALVRNGEDCGGDCGGPVDARPPDESPRRRRRRRRTSIHPRDEWQADNSREYFAGSPRAPHGGPLRGERRRPVAEPLPHRHLGEFPPCHCRCRCYCCGYYHHLPSPQPRWEERQDDARPCRDHYYSPKNHNREHPQSCGPRRTIYRPSFSRRRQHVDRPPKKTTAEKKISH